MLCIAISLTALHLQRWVCIFRQEVPEGRQAAQVYELVSQMKTVLSTDFVSRAIVHDMQRKCPKRYAVSCDDPCKLPCESMASLQHHSALPSTHTSPWPTASQTMQRLRDSSLTLCIQGVACLQEFHATLVRLSCGSHMPF